MSRASIQKVVESGICVGCGACAVATKGVIAVAQNELGFRQAVLGRASAGELQEASKVCPFSDDASDEDSLAQGRFATDMQHDPRIGFFSGTYAARVIKGEDVELSSSGGLTSWMTLKLLDEGIVDGVIHVASSEEPDGTLFRYVVSTTSSELRLRRKSQYYSTSLNETVQGIRGNGKRYAIVGVPCFIKAARLLAKEDAVLGEQLKYYLGLVCGHLKSSGFAELMAWQMGVPPDALAKADFRIKQAGMAAADYSFGAWRKGKTEPMVRPTRSLLGGNWGHAMFQLKACDYCDDIFAETADIAFGDAWLPEYADDWRGTNVIVCRNETLKSLLEAGAQRGELFLDPISADLCAKSQGGNYRHRWDGLSLRLADDQAAGAWAPRKRIAPGSRPLSTARTNVIRLRRKLASLSHFAFRDAKRAKDLDVFVRQVSPLVEAIDREYRAADSSQLRNIARKIKRAIITALR
jgi:coenzyme F420 hydrogenase subunit beta